MAPGIMITVSDLTMRYPIPRRYTEILLHPLSRRWNIALRNANLHIAEGDSVALLGPNGAGKTTLLRLIGGLIYPYRGRVEVNKCDTVTHNLKARQSVGFVMNEERSFYWRLTGAQNLEFFGSLDNLAPAALRERIPALLRLVGLEQDGSMRVSNYSTGMRQRLAIARGLLSEPAVLLLDEPTRSLDPLGADRLRSLISGHLQAKAAKTLLIATHNIHEAETLCNRVCCLYRGRILAVRDLAECAPGSKPEPPSGGLTAFYQSLLTRAERGDGGS